MKLLRRFLIMTALFCAILAIFTVPAAAGDHYCSTWDEVASAIRNDSDKNINIYLNNNIQSGYAITIDKPCKIKILETNRSTDCYVTGGKHRAFVLDEDEIKIVFSNNLHFQYFYGSDEGGAIYVDGDDCEIYDGFFEYCSAEEGGAFYLDGVGTYVAGCCFVENSAEDGGAIYVNDDAKIMSCNFFDNEADEDGGAIYDNNEVGDVFIDCCQFFGGDCGGDGIWVYCDGDAIITRCTEGDEDYYDDPDGDSDSSYTGSTFSRGVLWIIIVIAVAAVAAIILLAAMKKKKKTAVSENEADK